LVRFYFEVFGCEPEGPERDMSGAWLDELTSLRDAHLTGVHLRLPGYGDDGPTLEIFSYDRLIESELPGKRTDAGSVTLPLQSTTWMKPWRR